MRLIPVRDLADQALAPFTSLTDVQLRSVREPEEGIFLAESHTVIERALAAGLTPISLLVLDTALPRMQKHLGALPGTEELPVYVGSEEQLMSITGFNLHRGVIGAFRRPEPLAAESLISTARRLVVLENLGDHTNIGAIFRNCAALGVDGVLLSPSCADPLYRRSVRVSMGTVLQVPWAYMPRWQHAGPALREAGFDVVALALAEDAENLASYVARMPAKTAFVFGAEGPGLTRQALASATSKVIIPMDHGVDSLNVATTAAIVLWAARSAAERGAAGAS